LTDEIKDVPTCFRCPYEKADVSAFQALEKGEATPDQQKRALAWLINVGSMSYEDVYDRDSERDSTFMNGRRFVGLRVVKMLRINLLAFRSKNA